MCSLVAVWGSYTIFSLFFLFIFLNSNKAFSRIFHSNSLLLNALHWWLSLLLLCHPRVSGVPLIPSICSLGYQNQCCVSNIGGWSIPHSSLFPSFEVPSLKTPSWLSRSGDPRGLTFDISFSKASKFHFFRPTFWLLSPFSFFSNELIPFYQAKTSPATFFNGPSSWVPWGTRPLLISCWFLSLLILFLHIRWLMGHICPCSSCFWACPLELSQSQPGLTAHPKDPKLLGIPRYPGPVFLLELPSDFLTLEGWAGLLLSFVSWGPKLAHPWV